MVYEIKTVRAPAMPEWLFIYDGQRSYLIPDYRFRDLLQEAVKKFKSVAPLAPYPDVIGVVWKTDKRTYTWFIKRLQEIQKEYESELGLDKKLEDID